MREGDERPVNRPQVICHMTMSMDGKVTGSFLFAPQCAHAVDVYYEINRNYRADAYACGRVTMAESFTGGWTPDLRAYADAKLPREDCVADKEAAFFAVAFDRFGRLGWKAPRIEDEDPGYGGAHIIEVLLEDAPDAYLAYLRDTGVSYIFAGSGEMDIPLALEKLKGRFGIRKLLLEGGSVINGAFLRAGMIDEVSLVLAPVTADAQDKPLFMDGKMEDFALNDVKRCDGGTVVLRYMKK